MPLDFSVFSGDPARHDSGDWFYTSACASFSATPLQIAPSAGAGNYNYISTIHWTSTSAQTVTIWDGASASIVKFYAEPGLTRLEFPRGLELKTPTDGSNIKALTDVSAQTFYTITGFKKPYIA